MKFIKKIIRNKKFKKTPYFYSKYSDSIGLYEKHYSLIKQHLPFHSIEKTGEFIIIQLSCPLKSYYSYKKFYHFGDRLDFTYLKEKNVFPVETWRNENDKGNNCEVEKDGDTPLTENFYPCSLCKNELSCMFSPTKLTFQPKQYDTLYILDTLKENSFVESEALYHQFITYYDDEYGYYSDSDLANATWKDIVIVFLMILPIAILYLPIHFLWMFTDSIKDKFKPAPKS